MGNMQIDWLLILSPSVRYSTLCEYQWSDLKTRNSWTLIKPGVYGYMSQLIESSNEALPMAFMGSCCCADSVVSNTELLLQPFPQRGGRSRVFVFSWAACFHRTCRNLVILKNLSSLIWLSLRAGSKHVGEKAHMRTGTDTRVLGALLLQEPTEQSQTGDSC